MAQIPSGKWLTEIEAVVATVHTVISIINLRRRRRRKLQCLNRRWWTKPWILRRDECGRELHSLLNDELRTEDIDSYKNFLRMNEQAFNKLLQLVGPKLTKQNTVMRESISASRRFLATGESYRNLMFSFRIPASTISTIIPETCAAIYHSLKETYMKLPSTQNEWRQISRRFEELWNFPNCLGALDGKRVEFRPPRSMGSYFYNYKGGNSIVLLALVDAQYRFIFVDDGCNGRISDGGVFKNSPLYNIVTCNSHNFPPPEILPGTETATPFTIVADDAFPLYEHIMKPYKGNLTQQQKVFNYRLSRARRTSENAFGILSNRFRVLLKKNELPVKTVELITLSACALHNSLLETCGSKYMGQLEKEDTDKCVITPGEWNNGLMRIDRSKVGIHRSGNEARQLRDTLQGYFNTAGFVPCQWESIKRCKY